MFLFFTLYVKALLYYERRVPPLPPPHTAKLPRKICVVAATFFYDDDDATTIHTYAAEAAQHIFAFALPKLFLWRCVRMFVVFRFTPRYAVCLCVHDFSAQVNGV